MRSRGLAGLAASALLAACSQWPTQPAAPDAPAASQAPAPAAPIQGRLQVKVAAHGSQAARSSSASFELAGSATAGQFQLWTPVGTLVAEARWAAGLVQLRTPDGERQFDSLDALAQETLGEPVPLAALPDWLLGRPQAGVPHQSEVDGFSQLGWRIDTSALAEGRWSAWRNSPPAVRLSARLDRPSAP